MKRRSRYFDSFAAITLATVFSIFGVTAGTAQDKCDTVKVCAEQMVALANSLKEENVLLMNKIGELEKEISEIKSSNFVRTDKLAEEADKLGFVKFDSPLSIRDNNQPSVVVTRHGAGGNYLSPYPEGASGLGPQASNLWVLRRKQP